MLEIKVDVNVKCPDLIVILEKLNTCACKDAPKQNMPILSDLVNRQPAVSNLYPAPMPEQVLPTTVTSGPYVPAATFAETPVVAPVEPPKVPTEAPSFTLAQIAKAGADLLTAKPTLQGQLTELLARYEAPTVVALKPEHFGAFAAELRKLGAKI